MKLNIRDIPEEGLHVTGQTNDDIFELKEGDIAPSGPVTWDGMVSVVTDTALFQGSLRATFQAKCARCMEDFELAVELPDAILNAPIEGQWNIDLTDSIREDILLALPTYPRCENGISERTCPASSEFEEQEDLEEQNPEGTSDAWTALEKLGIRDTNDQHS